MQGEIRRPSGEEEETRSAPPPPPTATTSSLISEVAAPNSTLLRNPSGAEPPPIVAAADPPAAPAPPTPPPSSAPLRPPSPVGEAPVPGAAMGGGSGGGGAAAPSPAADTPYEKARRASTPNAATATAALQAGETLEGKVYGTCLVRTSFRSLVLKDWKECFWVLENPNLLMVFRNAANYRGYHENKMISPEERELLCKSRIDLSVKYFCKGVGMKKYSGKTIHTFALQEKTDLGPLMALKFGSPFLDEMIDLRNMLQSIIPHFQPTPRV